MSYAANRTWIRNTAISIPPSAFSQSSWLASAEFGIELPGPADKIKITGRRYINLEPLVSEDFDEETGIPQ